MTKTLAISLAVLAASTRATVAPIVSRQTETEFNWTAITPSPELQYHDCYGVYKCARLQVPMDWSNPSSNNSSVAIAIVTLPATVPATDPSFGGTVITNPGGPNGAGTTFMVDSGIGPFLQNILEGERHYEIMSFDPRGVFRTTPSADCYRGDVEARVDQYWQTRGWLPFADNLREQYIYKKGLSQLCEETTSEILQHMSSASVARDMVEIIDKVDALRTRETNSTYGRRSDTDRPRLQYIGFSYGSGLGMIFASMFPERVGRLAIDGILDIYDYTSGSWRENLNDAEAVVNTFYQQCFDVGDRCTLKKPSDTAWTDLKARVDGLLNDLDESPVPVIYQNRVVLVTSDDVRSIILLALYSPAVLFPSLAETLAQGVAGNFSTLLQGLEGAPTEYTWPVDVRSAVAFSDAPAETANRNLSYFEEYVGYLEHQAPTVGASLWADITLGFVGRTLRPKYAFDGPYTTPQADPHNSSAPSAPMLILSNRLDPVTPLANAFKMTDVFPGASVTVQESAGHCALFASISACTNRIVRDYFDTGKVPANGTVCEASCHPFVGCSSSNSTAKRAGIPAMPRPFFHR